MGVWANRLQNIYIFTTLILLALLVVACGGSSGKSQEGTGPSGTGTQPTTSKSTTSLFGIRNFSEITQAKQWSKSELANEFASHNMGYGAFWIFWKLLEPKEDEFDFTELDYSIERVQALDLTPVVVVHLDAPWAMGSSSDGAGYTGPNDLAVGSTATWPPPKGGYSEEVYEMATAIAKRLAKAIQGEVLIRFHNEAWTEWPLGTPTASNTVSNEMRSNMNNYLLSFFTLKLAFEEVAKNYPDVDFLYGHGSIPRGYILYRNWLSLGQNDPSQREMLLKNFVSVTERNTPVVSWEDVVSRFGLNTPLNIAYDYWVDQFIEWTRDGYFDFMTRHSHEKYLFINDERDLIENALGAQVASKIRWTNAETAYEMLDPSSWPPQLTGNALNNFVAETLARKWVTLLSRKEAFMSPVLGVPYPKYIGLFEPNASGGLKELPSNQVFMRLSNLLGSVSRVDVLREDDIAIYRFTDDANDRVIDVTWYRVLEDNNTSLTQASIASPSGYSSATIKDVFGNTLHKTTTNVTLAIEDLSQRPQIVIWRR